jgi:hypothetical protein
MIEGVDGYRPSMTDAEYMQFLYDRAARRDGYESHEAQRAYLESLTAERDARERASQRADMEAWAKIQLSMP